MIINVLILSLSCLFSGVLAAIGCYQIGNFFVERTAFLKILIGAVFIWSATLPLIYYKANLVRPVIIFLLFIAQITFFFNKRKLISELIPFISQKRKAILAGFQKIIFPFILISMSFLLFSPPFYIYENHDVLYYGWLNGIWEFADQSYLILKMIYPLELGTNHLLSGGIIGVFGIYLPSFNLVNAIFIKYVILVCSFVDLNKEFCKDYSNSVKIIFAYLVTILLFGSEITYNLSISTYLTIILLLYFLLNIESFSLKNDSAIILIAILISKASIIFTSLATLTILLYKIRGEIKYSRILLFGIVSLNNLFSWVFTRKGWEVSHSEYSFIGIKFKNNSLVTNLDAYLKSYLEVYNWVVDSIFKNYFDLSNSDIAIIIFAVIFVILKIYILYSYIIRKYIVDSKIIYNTFMGTSLVFFITLRNNDHISISAHYYLIASTVTAFLVFRLIQKNMKESNLLIYSVVALIAFLIYFKYIPLGSNIFDKRNNSNSAYKISNEDFAKNKINIYNDEDKNQAIAQVKSAIRNQILYYDSDLDYSGSQIYLFSVQPK